jgi:hypothetical protein
VKQKLGFTWIGKENWPKPEPRVLIEDTEKSYYAQHRVTDRDLFDDYSLQVENLPNATPPQGPAGASWRGGGPMTIGSNMESEVILYQTEDGKTRVEGQFKGETAWLSLNQMAELFQRDKSVISRHIGNIFEEGELPRDSVVANFAITASDGKTYRVDYYNLDVIISVGYRVKSHRGTQYRSWATQLLCEYIIKGFGCCVSESSLSCARLIRPATSQNLAGNVPRVGGN